MLNNIELKIRQMRLALGSLEDTDISRITPQEIPSGVLIDFNQGSSPESLANAASLLCASIGCMRDYLKVWCGKNSIEFNGDALINSNRDVAIVHDLWNIDKHAELSRKSRSGVLPRIVDLRRSITVESGTEGGGHIEFVFDPVLKRMVQRSSKNCALIIDGDVLDERGILLGRFADICQRAVDAWEAEFRKTGVPLHQAS